MPSTDRIIWDKFRIKRRDNLPYTGWTGHRDMLAEMFAELKYTHGAEVGVRMGEFSKILLDANPGLQLLCVDPWAAYERVNAEKQKKYYDIAVNTLGGYNAVLMKMTSEAACADIKDRSLDFVYIDGAHSFDNVVIDLIKWSSKVKHGGIISGHDYYPFYQGGVMLAVDAYTRAHNIQNWYVTREKEPSFFWVNP